MMYYPSQPTATRLIGFEEQQLILTRVKRQKQLKEAGVMSLIGLLAIAAVSLML